MEASKCPKCGEEPHFLEHIEKWYCYGCNTYIEDGTEHLCADTDKKEECVKVLKEDLESLDEEPRLECKNCGAELEGLKDGVLYCYVCETYQNEKAAKPDPSPKEANDAQKILDIALTKHAPKPAEVAPAPVEPEPGPAPVAKETPAEPAGAPIEVPGGEVRMCPSCGLALKWIEKYQRHYCYGCKRYASKDGGEKAAPQAPPAQQPKACPGCGSELKFIEKYSEYYCFACRKYPLREAKKAESKKEAAPPVEAQKKPSALLCPKCNGELRWIEKYSRHYCNACKEYAPKGFGGVALGSGEKKQCPSCKGPMKFIAEYNEWYCYKCRKYSLRPSKPVLLM
ncbi:MAG: hypothetical protein JW880_08615 [Candidatus Thermoplasmatota archaeon]|nr:hypothetical protein [Candidatus Thermoplasmatota archaeon]